MDKTEMAIISREEILEKFNDVKQKIAAVNANIKAIIIIDQESCERAMELGILANKISNAVDDKRKAVKKPYYEAGKVIDKTADEIVGELDQSLVMLKHKIKVYNDDVEAKKQEEFKKLQKEQQAQKALLETSLSDLDSAKKFVDDITDETISGLSETNDSPGTIDQMLAKFPKPTTFGTAVDIVRNFRNKMLQLKETLERKASGSTEAKKAHAKMFNEFVNFSAANFEKIEEEIKTQEKAETLTSINKMTDVDSTKSGASTRKRWIYEVNGFSEVPLQYLMIDDAAVKKFMKENQDKETGTINGTIPGITFKQDTTVVFK